MEGARNEEREILLARIERNNKQGTINHFFTEKSSLRTQESTQGGGGWKVGGVRTMTGGPRPTDSTLQTIDGSKNRGLKKTKAQARKKPKKGAKSTRGREPGPRRESDSSQWTLRNFSSL